MEVPGRQDKTVDFDRRVLFVVVALLLVLIMGCVSGADTSERSKKSFTEKRITGFFGMEVVEFSMDENAELILVIKHKYPSMVTLVNITAFFRDAECAKYIGETFVSNVEMTYALDCGSVWAAPLDKGSAYVINVDVYHSDFISKEEFTSTGALFGHVE